MRNRFVLGGALLLAAVAVSGCSRMTATTDVKADGSFTRSLAYSESKPIGSSGGAQLSDTFVLPQAPAWKVSKTIADGDVKYGATIRVAAGQTLARDVSVRRKDQGPVLVTNKVSVAQVSPGRWRYTETIHWNGPIPKEVAVPEASTLSQIKLALPASVATDDTVRALAPALARAVWSVLFGPGEPVLPQLFLQPDAAERTMRRRAGRGIEKVLADKLGGKLNAAERRQTTRRILSALTAVSQSKKDNPTGGAGDDGTDLPSLSFVLKVPGHLVSTNGETDDYSDDVFWTLYPEAAALGDVTLSAEWTVR
ncbi:MAG TPA: hypothetical protein VGM37_18975 [Armatimonadota bacterium]|jgi:hypothetical protein